MTDITVHDHPVSVGRPLYCGLRDMAATVTGNPLRTKHEQDLEAARKKEAAATSPFERASALQDEAAALDSLGKPDEALARIDDALRLADPSRSKDLIATKAGIEFSLNNPQQALALLAPEIGKIREFAAHNPQLTRAGVLVPTPKDSSQPLSPIFNWSNGRRRSIRWQMPSRRWRGRASMRTGRSCTATSWPEPMMPR